MSKFKVFQNLTIFKYFSRVFPIFGRFQDLQGPAGNSPLVLRGAHRRWKIMSVNCLSPEDNFSVCPSNRPDIRFDPVRSGIRVFLDDPDPVRF